MVYTLEEPGFQAAILHPCPLFCRGAVAGRVPSQEACASVAQDTSTLGLAPHTAQALTAARRGAALAFTRCRRGVGHDAGHLAGRLDQLKGRPGSARASRWWRSAKTSAHAPSSWRGGSQRIGPTGRSYGKGQQP